MTTQELAQTLLQHTNKEVEVVIDVWIDRDKKWKLGIDTTHAVYSSIDGFYAFRIIGQTRE
jgi:hypothetical protein